MSKKRLIKLSEGLRVREKKNFFKVRFSFFFFVLISFFSSKALSSTPLSPKDIQRALAVIPGGELTLDFIFNRGIQSSSELKMILSEKISANAPYLRSKAFLDYQLFSDFYFLDDRKDRLIATEPENIKSPNYTLGVSKNFLSGTQISTQWNHRLVSLEYQNESLFRNNEGGFNFSFFTPPEEYYNSQISFTLSQSLLKDSFGRLTRKRLEANQITKNVVQFRVYEKMERLFFQFVDSFHKAWLLKKKIKASKENLKRQRRLLNITQVQKKRGTEIQSNLLLIQAHLITIEEQKKIIEQDLKNLWHSLVISLNFPKPWLDFDPFLVPMRVHFEREKALNFCATTTDIESILKKNPGIQKINQDLKSKKLMISYWKDQSLPDLSLKLKLDSNSYNEKLYPAFKETLKFNHPFWSVGLNLNFTFSSSREKAELSEWVERKTFLLAQLEKKKLDFKVLWLNQCQKLKMISNKIKTYQKVYEIQKERSQLEERRFQIGRTSAFNAIQAGKDVINAESTLYKFIHDAEILSWKIYQMQGYLLESILSQLK